MLKEKLIQSGMADQADAEVAVALAKGLAAGLFELQQFGVIKFPGGHMSQDRLELAVEAAGTKLVEKIGSLAPRQN